MQSESDLTVTLDDLKNAVAVELGYGESYSDCGDGEKTVIDALIIRGQRRFYRPPPVRGKVHQWSFMRPLFTFTTVAEQWEYPLPAEYAGFDGDVTRVDQDSLYSKLESTMESNIRRWRTQDDTSGEPRYFSIIAMAHDRTHGQRYQMMLYPTPSEAVELQFRMLINPQAITKFAPFPYGGTQYGEAILASCLAIAELSRDGVMGTRHADWMTQLDSAILLDQDVHEPDVLGLNLDGSIRRCNRGPRRTDGFTVTYNGVEY